ncbi:MAG: hypothetical protein HYV28_07470 [Ignavibacteriales bacterium]|nr:hypothetical protein [Ignavibacteriales bacterium]
MRKQLLISKINTFLFAVILLQVIFTIQVTAQNSIVSRSGFTAGFSEASSSPNRKVWTSVGELFTGSGQETNAGISAGFFTSGSFLSDELRLTALLEGFYNIQRNAMISDSIMVSLKSMSAMGFSTVDSSKGILDSTGFGIFHFPRANQSIKYFLTIKHRNSIETWSDSIFNFAGGKLSFNFSDSISRAYGGNLKQVGSRFCIYTGDVNQDGFVDFTDLTMIDNDAYNFSTGYLQTDLTGDNFIDFTDLSLCDNNAYNFVGVRKPGQKFVEPLRRLLKEHNSIK